MQKTAWSTIENVCAIAGLVWLASEKLITGQWAAILICVVIGVISAQQIVAFLRGTSSSTTTTTTTDSNQKPNGPPPGVLSLLLFHPAAKAALGSIAFWKGPGL